MKVLLILPKAHCYDNKDDNTQRRYIDVFKKYVKMLDDAGCPIIVTLEDKLAFDVLKSLEMTPDKVVTCISPSDFELIRKYPDIEELDNSVFINYSSTQVADYDMERKYPVSPTLISKGAKAFFDARIKIYRKRYKAALNQLIHESTNVMQFRINGQSDRGNAVSTDVRQGDGRLCIEIDVAGERCTAYYGGAYIPEDMLPTILSL